MTQAPIAKREGGPPLRLLLVDDHTLFRESLKRLLESEPSLVVCGDFANAEGALAALHSGLEFDVALIDYELSEDGGSTGLDLVRRMQALYSDAKVLIVTAGMDPESLIHAVTELNTGVFLKSEATMELMLAIHRTAQGERWISSRASLAVISARNLPAERLVSRPDQLSPRESRVLRGILEGCTNKEIGVQLDMTESSVKAVLQKLFERTGVRSRSQLVRYAIEVQIEPK